MREYSVLKIQHFCHFLSTTPLTRIDSYSDIVVPRHIIASQGSHRNRQDYLEAESFKTKPMPLASNQFTLNYFRQKSLKMPLSWKWPYFHSKVLQQFFLARSPHFPHSPSCKCRQSSKSRGEHTPAILGGETVMSVWSHFHDDHHMKLSSSPIDHYQNDRHIYLSPIDRPERLRVVSSSQCLGSLHENREPSSIWSRLWWWVRLLLRWLRWWI